MTPCAASSAGRCRDRVDSILSAAHVDKTFERTSRGAYALQLEEDQIPFPAEEAVPAGKATLVEGNCLNWLRTQPTRSIHAVVIDPPYGMVEYPANEQKKLRDGKGGVWRIPPYFDGHKRAPLPRFTTLDQQDLRNLERFFFHWATLLLPVLVPGANVIVASNPLVSHAFRRRPRASREIVRLVMTMRGGDRPKNAHEEFGEPQSFLRQLVRAVLPLGEGTILDPFAGAGSTLAAAIAVGYSSIGIERDPHYAEIARRAILPCRD